MHELNVKNMSLRPKILRIEGNNYSPSSYFIIQRTYAQAAKSFVVLTTNKAAKSFCCIDNKQFFLGKHNYCFQTRKQTQKAITHGSEHKSKVLFFHFTSYDYYGHISLNEFVDYIYVIKHIDEDGIFDVWGFPLITNVIWFLISPKCPSYVSSTNFTYTYIYR